MLVPLIASSLQLFAAGDALAAPATATGDVGARPTLQRAALDDPDDDASEDDGASGGASQTAVAREKKLRKDLRFEVGLRTRRISLPRDFLDFQFTDQDSDGWPIDTDRPYINGFAYGMEFVIQSEKTAGIIWFSYWDSNMPEGYWDEVEDPPDYADGDWLRPTPNLGLITFGGDYAYAVPMVKLSQTRQAFGMDFMVGGGLGLGLMVGQLDRWIPSDSGEPAYVLVEQGEPPSDNPKKIPRVWPIVDVNLGFRFNFGDRVTLRLEGGLHTLLYYGGSLGFRF